MPKEISLVDGRVALVDDDMYEDLRRFEWYGDKNGYAHLLIRAGEFCAHTTISIHRIVMNAKEGERVYRLNSDRLDNRRCNLTLETPGTRRKTTRATASAGSVKPRRKHATTSRYRGVSWNANLRKWEAVITVDLKRHHLGLHDDETVAAKAYDDAAIRLRGDKARLNFPR